MPTTSLVDTIAETSLGIRLRREYISPLLELRPDLDWLEIISENYLDASDETLGQLSRIRQNYPMVMHGLSLSIGSPWPINLDYLKRIRQLADRLQPVWISDHLCWSGADDLQGSLMPLPYSREMLEHLVPRIQQAQEILRRPLLLENVPATARRFSNDMPEAEFLREVALQSGCELLIDLDSLKTSCANSDSDLLDYLRTLPADRIRQFHLCGATFFCGNCLQPDIDQEPDPIWELYRQVVDLLGPRPTLIEREDSIPPLQEMLSDLIHARCAIYPETSARC